MSTPREEPPADQPMHAAYRRYVAAIVLYHQVAAERTGLNPTDFQALNLLTLNGPCSPGELSQRTGLTTGATTRMIDRLERQGYVRRERDADDRRRVLVSPTGHEPADLDGTLAAVREKVGAVIAGFSPEQAAAVLAYVTGAAEAYREAAEELRTPPSPPSS